MADKYENLFVIDTDVVSDERYDLAKFMPYKVDTYDVLNCPFLMALKKLPVWRYYRVNEGYKDIDMISYDAYNTLFYAYIIQYYNDTTLEHFEEDTVLKLPSIEDLEDLYANLINKDLSGIV